jgi:hypothetical protein
MAADRFFPYDTKAEAWAFAEGVDYVNDSDCLVKGVFWVPGPRGRRQVESTYVVRLVLMDRDDTDKPPKRWKQAERLEQE